jgi:hypothetical protein
MKSFGYKFQCHHCYYSPVFLNRRASARYRALAKIILGPRLIEKRIYRAAVRQS